MDFVHVYPVGDLLEHNITGIPEPRCWCNPCEKYDFDNDTCVVVHEALDGRE